MANLFGKNKLRSIAQQIDTEEIKPLIEIVKEWHVDYHNGSLRRDKETSREQEYNQQFFKAILGYKEKPASPFSFEPKATTDKGQLPDAVISYTDTANDIRNTVAVVELKGAAIDLDRPQRREGNMSPVQQGFKYKAQYRACPFVIVSNFWEFRLYHDNLLDYEAWTLDDLVNPDDDYILFKTWYALLKHDNFTTNKGASKTEILLSDIRIEQENIGKKFYKVYREARLDLLRDIYSNNDSVRDNIDVGIEKAQKIVDRIVFAAFAEDRGLLPDNTLQRVIKAADSSTFGGSLWNTLKGFFEAIDVGSEKLEIPDGYNGGLFKHDETLNNLRINDAPLRKVVELGTYNFSEDLSVNILGHIFEQSISDLEEIKSKVRESQNIEALAVSRRKKDGIFYTPDNIVRYIVDNSLGAYLREHEEKFKNEFGLKGDITDKTYEKREKQAYSKYQDFLQNIKVVDPACGSGAFLVYVFDYLLAENKRVSDIVGNSLFSSDTYVRDILRNNIYGVDLNEESVEITKLSLWLKTAQKGKKLTALDGNIKCGNSLIDDPKVAEDKALNWREQFADVFKNGGFDVVIGNPPYGAQFPDKDKEYIRNTFKSYKYKYESYFYFIEKFLGFIKTGGYLGYITPSMWLELDMAKPLRAIILDRYDLKSIAIYGEGIFSDATVNTCSFVIKVDMSTDSLALTFNGTEFTVKKSSFINSDNLQISYRTSPLQKEIIDVIQAKSKPLSTFGEVIQGITAYDKFRGQSEEIIKSKAYHYDYKFDDSTGHWLDGKDISRYSVQWGGKWLRYGEWLAAPREKRFFEGIRILFREIPGQGLRIQAAVCKDEAYYGHSISPFKPYEQYEHITYGLLAVANSKLISWYGRIMLPNLGKGVFPKINPQDISSIPIIDNEAALTALGDLASKTQQLVTKLNSENIRFEALISNNYKTKTPRNWWRLNSDAYLKSFKGRMSLEQKDELLRLFDKYRIELQSLDEEIQKIDNEIDQLVYEMYELTPKEIVAIEGQ